MMETGSEGMDFTGFDGSFDNLSGDLVEGIGNRIVSNLVRHGARSAQRQMVNNRPRQIPLNARPQVISHQVQPRQVITQITHTQHQVPVTAQHPVQQPQIVSPPVATPSALSTTTPSGLRTEVVNAQPGHLNLQNGPPSTAYSSAFQNYVQQPQTGHISNTTKTIVTVSDKERQKYDKRNRNIQGWKNGCMWERR